MGMNKFFLLTGKWPANPLPLEGFLECALGAEYEATGCQLVQTCSRCALEALDKTMALGFPDIEQYRAFCNDWELWLRSLHGGVLRFRLTAKVKIQADAQHDLNNKGFDNLEVHEKDYRTVSSEYPLWGEPLPADARHKAGWYTQRIPQIIQYPVDFPQTPKSQRVFLKAQHLMEADDSVELVRYVGLKVRDL